MGSGLAAIRVKMFSSWAPFAMITTICQGRRRLAGWECVPPELMHELSCCFSQSQHDSEPWIHGKHHSRVCNMYS